MPPGRRSAEQPRSTASFFLTLGVAGLACYGACRTYDKGDLSWIAEFGGDEKRPVVQLSESERRDLDLRLSRNPMSLIFKNGQRCVLDGRTAHEELQAASNLAGITPEEISAVIYIESVGKCGAKPPIEFLDGEWKRETRAEGVGQMIPVTRQEMVRKYFLPNYKELQRFIPGDYAFPDTYREDERIRNIEYYLAAGYKENPSFGADVFLSGKYLQSMLKTFGNMDWALVAYHGGPGYAQNVRNALRATRLGTLPQHAFDNSDNETIATALATFRGRGGWSTNETYLKKGKNALALSERYWLDWKQRYPGRIITGVY